MDRVKTFSLGLVFCVKLGSDMQLHNNIMPKAFSVKAYIKIWVMTSNLTQTSFGVCLTKCHAMKKSNGRRARISKFSRKKHSVFIEKGKVNNTKKPEKAAMIFMYMYHFFMQHKHWRGPFHQRLHFRKFDSMEMSFCSHPNSDQTIATDFCTWCDNCANNCTDLIAISYSRAKPQRNEIYTELELRTKIKSETFPGGSYVT